MSSWIWNRLRPTPPNLHKVTVFETASCGAVFDGRQYVQRGTRFLPDQCPML